MKFGISSSIYEAKFRDLAKKSKELDKLYLEYIDSIVNFALKHKLKIIEISGLLNNISEILPPLVGEIKKRIKTFEEVSFHLPVNFRPIEETKTSISAAKQLGAKVIVYHPDYEISPFKTEEERREKILELVSFCESHGLMLCLENLPLENKNFHKPEEFDFYIEKGAFLTLDTGHAVICSIDPIEFLDRFGNKVRNIHLQSGIRGAPDIHYALGNGDFDYLNFFKKLKEIKYDGLLILELLSEKTALDSLNQLKFMQLI
ncbi:MAG: sugar phosphate isomerase/epimerase [Candidatus Aenigmarchaeota archaeon]|nr:sugar phosphate isomerase/epimerase [Candidatus Aenigmarchaeota archaeon]